MPDRALTILQLTHQGGGSGSTTIIANVSRQLARRGHRVRVGCRPGTMHAQRAWDAGREVVAPHCPRLGPPAGGRLRVVPNGIDCERIDTPPSEAELAAARTALGDVAGRPIVLVLARRKDQHILLQGLAALERPVVVACVGIEGDAELRAIERSMPPRHRVVYVPFTDRPFAFCRLAALSALPSRIEGLSIALLETMALGLPAVVSHAGGNPDVITSGTTGVLVPPLDPRAWADALARVLGDRAFAQRIARAGRDT